jgi:hypothetical protein
MVDLRESWMKIPPVATRHWRAFGQGVGNALVWGALGCYANETAPADVNRGSDPTVRGQWSSQTLLHWEQSGVRRPFRW